MSAMPRIMAVDDEESVTSLIVDYFISEGFEIKGYTDPNLALIALNKGHFEPDVILVDIMMPEMDGYEFCHRVQTAHPGKGYTLIFLTDKDREDDSLRFAASGGNLFIKKPFQLNELKSVVMFACGKTAGFESGKTG